jgi:hypothetical protein
MITYVNGHYLCAWHRLLLFLVLLLRMSCSSRSFLLFCIFPLFDFNIKLPKMNDSNLLAASVQKVQAAKKGFSLPTSLEDAAISDVIVEDVVGKVTQEALLDNNGKPISTASKKLQLEQNTSSYVMNVCTLTDSASGNSAREVMQTMIQSNTRDKKIGLMTIP